MIVVGMDRRCIVEDRPERIEQLAAGRRLRSQFDDQQVYEATNAVRDQLGELRVCSFRVLSEAGSHAWDELLVDKLFLRV